MVDGYVYLCALFSLCSQMLYLSVYWLPKAFLLYLYNLHTCPSVFHLYISTDMSLQYFCTQMIKGSRRVTGCIHQCLYIIINMPLTDESMLHIIDLIFLYLHKRLSLELIDIRLYIYICKTQEAWNFHILD